MNQYPDLLLVTIGFRHKGRTLTLPQTLLQWGTTRGPVFAFDTDICKEHQFVSICNGNICRGC